MRHAGGERLRSQNSHPWLQQKDEAPTGSRVAAWPIHFNGKDGIVGSPRVRRNSIQVTSPTLEPKYEDQFVAFVDFLGFSEASAQTSETTRSEVLKLLLSLSGLRREFEMQSTVQKNGTTRFLKPAISTFSDHIVISYPLQPIYAEYAEMGPDEFLPALVIITQFTQLLERIAAEALRIGFLVRGGATIGKLYHAHGVVFGEALIEAFQIESRTSIYPRVVLSSQITRRPKWIEHQPYVAKCSDGLYHFDYFKSLLLDSASPGDAYGANVRAWFNHVLAVVARNLTELESRGSLNELAKWAWFAREFRGGLESMNPGILKSLEISLDAISWPR